MANTKKNTDADINTEEVKKEAVDTKKLNKENEQLLKENQELIDRLNKLESMFEKLQAVEQVQSSGETQTVQDFTNKKIEVVSLLNCEASLNTKMDGSGKTYYFPSYGTKKKIKFEDLEKLVDVTKARASSVSKPTSYFERGEFYICDNKVVAELGLDEAYENIISKDMIDEIRTNIKGLGSVYFSGASKERQEAIVGLIVDDIISNKMTDINYIRTLSDIYDDTEDNSKNIEKLVEMKKELLNNQMK